MRWKRNRPIIVVGGCVTLSVGLTVVLLLLKSSNRPWVETVARPGYTLLYLSESQGRHIAVFDTGKCELAIIDSQFGVGDGDYYYHSFCFLDPTGKNVVDKDRDPDILCRRRVGPIQWDAIGNIYPVSPDYHGEIRIEYMEHKRTNDGRKVDEWQKILIDVTIPWRQKEAGSAP